MFSSNASVLGHHRYEVHMGGIDRGRVGVDNS